MHPADDLKSARAATDDSDNSNDSRPLERAVARAAAGWLVRLHDDATPENLAACARWRAADPEHERAWQRAQKIDRKFSMLQPGVGLPALGRENRFDRRAAIKTLSALLVAGSAGYMAYRVAPWREWTSDERTATGERRTVVLADGTRVDLNTSTAFDIAFSDTERRVVLHTGEILVETGPDANRVSGSYRPFIVQTSQGDIRALGTRFDVRREPDDATRVAVLHGAVEITPVSMPALKRVIAAGEQTRFTATSIDPASAVDRHIADWSRGVLFADSVRLDDFAAELSRYRPGVLRCDPAVANLRITGAFQIGNTDNILAALPDTLPVRVIYRTRYWVTIAAGHQATET
ncbi:FecR family protein [Paraburkholderia fungorum]|uniref:FecR family protein n=1 Tax=Paraburkholderia fungorum TaxID=134537 RepID=A0A1H1JL09_9BURK|nr:FecR domain-containing protein [Paraburkholderia fungorum]SDR50355.1 FecR family protein [Paraburkholderia fungorum]